MSWAERSCLSVVPYADSTSIGYNNQKGKKYWRNISSSFLVGFPLCHFISLWFNVSRSLSLPLHSHLLYPPWICRVLTIWQAMKINLQCVKSYTYYRFCDVCTQFSNCTVAVALCHSVTLYSTSLYQQYSLFFVCESLDFVPHTDCVGFYLRWAWARYATLCR